MSNEQGLAPMEEDASPMYGYSPSNDEETESDDFVLVMDWAPTSLRDVPQDQHPVKKIAPPSSHVQSDEFSFGSSGDDEDNKDKNEKDPRRSFAHVSLSTTFDMNVLQACIEESADALDLVTGKDVVVVVGKTGVGKSLFIQGIAGKRIKASIHKTTFSGQSASKTVFEAENALPNFDIGHATSSKTRSINAFLRKEGDNETVYLDSPGLEDTRGVEMDIATSALLSQVARRCRSLRFVVLTHCASLLEDRGGAFRSVMRFAKTFVQDFDESKRSFMFLFTHTDEIAGMSSSVDDARRLLQEEIVRTADGTKEEDVALVLDFVRKSLKKKYPFADILHPIETDYHKLAQDIDMKLCKVTNLTLAMSCNLALSSKLRLEGAVRNLLQSLRNCLAHSSPNIAEVKRIQRTFHYLKEYVKVDCVRSAVFETEEVIDGQIKTMKKCISIEFSRGTSQDTDFEKENVQALSNTIDILQELDANFSSKQQIQTMKQGVIKLQGEIIRKAHCLEPFHRDLHKMKIWAEGFEEFSDMHAVSCNELSEYIGTVSGIVSIGDTELHYQESPDDFSIYAENLLALHVLCEHSFRFPTPEINTKNATSIRELALCRLRDGITLWSKKTDEFSDESTPIDYKNDLKDIAAHIETLEIIQQVIKKKGISITPIEKDVLQALKKVEDDVTGRYEVCCNELKDAASSFDPSWEPKLSWMRSVCHIFSRLQGVQWKVMHSSFILLIDKIKSVLYTAMGELDNMSNMIREHGMRHGKTMGIEYAKLSNCSWFDSYLPAEDEFIANFCTKIIADAKTRIDEKTFDLAERLKTLCTKQSPNTDTIEKIGLLIPELSEIDNFVAVATESTGLVVSTLYTHNGSGQSTDEAATLTAWCVRNLEKYAASLSQLATKCIGYWIKNLSTGRIGLMRSLTRKINSILVNATTLEIAVSADGLIRDKAQSILAAIYDGCKQFAHQVKSELKTFDGNFVLKAAFLTSVCACSGFTPIRDHLPDYKIIQHEIRDVVASEAHRIESDMETSSDWDRIDQCILQFKSATVLDDFVSNEVSSRLSTLQRQRDQKEVQVDDLLRDMIHVNNFKGIHAFISPFANSKDQVKRQKFDTYMDEICFSLALAIKDVERYIQQDSITENEYQLISRSIDILAQAKDNLQWLMKPKLDLASIISSLKFGINQKLEAYISQIVQAMREKDFVQAARSKHNATMCCQKLELCIKESNKRKMKSANSEYKQEIGNILKHLEMFFESRFEDVTDLSRSMSTLKRATEAGEVQLDELVSLYEELKKTLSDKVRKIISRVNESVSEAKCFDDVIPYFHALSRQMNGPLKMHCSVDLLMECENLNERLHLEKKEHDRSFDFGEDRIEQTIEMLAQRLDKLESPSVYQKIWLWMKNDERKTYINLQEKLNKKVEDISKRAQAALKSRDLRSVQECIEFLVFVDKKAQKHVKFVQTRLRGLCEKCIASFLELCDKAKRFLESKDTSQFEEMYADYHGFVLFIPCVLESRDSQRQFSLVNQMLYESLDHEVKALHAKANATVYDFSAFRAQVVRVRRVGNFFADRLTLLNEEIKRSAHASGDEWLGRIHAICSRHFGNGRDFSKIRHCVVLGVVPSATKADIRRAYFEKAKRNHPDKLRNASGDSGFMFRETKEAYDELLLMTHLSRPNQSRPFDEILTSIGEKLRTLSKKFMQEQCYDMVERLLFQLPNLNMLEDLVHPKLNSDAIKLSIHETIKGHVEKTRVDVNSSWSERNYKNLNDSISDLKQMENHFKSHPEIFPTSWNTGIMDAIETEIEALGQKARACLQSYKVAKTKEGKFKRYFVEMGFVLIELPPFKAFTKTVMANVLESCLDSDWGYSYIFEFGLTLQRGDESRTDEANRVAQMLLSEFDHFKEVMTMVWNQETSQKPVEDTVNNIRGEHRESAFRQTKLNIDQGQLLGSFFKYEHEYKTLLGEYIKPNADLNVLVRKTLALAENLKPLQCDVGWEDDVKQSIPIILAGVFALFTILKSGSSFNRIEAAGGSSDFGEKLLMKPHHIQVMAVLKMLGCGSGSTALESQLMQIRTGEGKSMTLGAASTMFALLGFRVRTVCYSEYLSSRDFKLFEEVFQQFGLLTFIKYSTITAFAEDSTAYKGDIRDLTESLLRGTLTMKESQNCPPEIESLAREEILLVDEVDVFFGADFYGQTYNQVVKFGEPEVAIILKTIWSLHCKGVRLRLNDVKFMPEYKRLLKKLSSFEFLLDNEISLMLHQVKMVDDVPYYLDPETDRIGYKVMDSISYDVTYGYASIFAYLKESSSLKNGDTLFRALVMPISCGQFSYANISPARILGVSGTLASMSEFEKDVLNEYGLNKFVYIPSVYGDSNFNFDQAGVGIYFEKNTSNFYHRIFSEIMEATKSKRAVIVFFRDRAKLNAFISSPTYQQLGRNKKHLTEDMPSSDKEFVINKAATTGQITLCTAVFGRGTDFFCKDENVEKNGGVHIIQTFLSEEVSEEVQIQGRTARQGKKGSYQMILLESELETDFGISTAQKNEIPKHNWYQWLCGVRSRHQREKSLLVEKNLEEATEKDVITYDYFDSLIARKNSKASEQFKNLYLLMKKQPLPSAVGLDLAFAIDVTGSMAPYAQCAASTVKKLITGPGSIVEKLKSKFPEIQFMLRVGFLGYRDIGDKNQFQESVWSDGSHFTENMSDANKFIKDISKAPSGGFDVAEDHIGAINRITTSWNHTNDWFSEIKCLLLLSDAPSHGLVSEDNLLTINSDNYPTRHPDGLTAKNTISHLLSEGIDLFFCSFNPAATRRTEEEISTILTNHPDNSSERDVIRIPMVPVNKYKSRSSSLDGGQGRHIIFVLDESGSMSNSWAGVVHAYRKYKAKRQQSQSESDLVSVIQFSSSSRITVRMQPLSVATGNLVYHGGGTSFNPAACDACSLARETPQTHIPAIIFMSDGKASDSSSAAREFSKLNVYISAKSEKDLELHVISFGSCTDDAQLQEIASASQGGRVHASSNIAELADVFVSIATNENVSTLLESEIAKRISEAVSDKLTCEYFRS